MGEICPFPTRPDTPLDPPPATSAAVQRVETVEALQGYYREWCRGMTLSGRGHLATFEQFEQAVEYHLDLERPTSAWRKWMSGERDIPWCYVAAVKAAVAEVTIELTVETAKVVSFQRVGHEHLLTIAISGTAAA